MIGVGIRECPQEPSKVEAAREALLLSRDVIVGLIDAEYNVETWGLWRHLSKIDAALRVPSVCEVCGGDCSAANPPPIHCPERDGPLEALESHSLVLADANTNQTAPSLSSLRKGAEVAVKPLEWVVGTWHGTVVFKAKTVVGEYMVAPKAWGSDWLWRLDLHWDDTYYSVADEDEGKAAAQSDFETRIRSALVSGSREDGDGPSKRRVKECCDSEGQPCSRCLEAALSYTSREKSSGE